MPLAHWCRPLIICIFIRLSSCLCATSFQWLMRIVVDAFARNKKLSPANVILLRLLYRTSVCVSAAAAVSDDKRIRKKREAFAMRAQPYLCYSSRAYRNEPHIFLVFIVFSLLLFCLQEISFANLFILHGRYFFASQLLLLPIARYCL